MQLVEVILKSDRKLGSPGQPVSGRRSIGRILRETASCKLAEREGFELGRWLSEISKLLNRLDAPVPLDPPDSPYLPPDLPPR